MTNFLIDHSTTLFTILIVVAWILVAFACIVVGSAGVALWRERKPT